MFMDVPNKMERNKAKYAVYLFLNQMEVEDHFTIEGDKDQDHYVDFSPTRIMLLYYYHFLKVTPKTFLPTFPH